MAATPEKPQRRPGRPSKAEELRRVLAGIGIDPSAIDPLRILAAIAANGSMPPTARVNACRALIAARDPERSEDSAVAGDAVSVRAQQLLAARRRAN
jgi:hypothetical protein